MSLLRRCLLLILVIGLFCTIFVMRPRTDIAMTVFTAVIKPKESQFSSEVTDDPPTKSTIPPCPVKVVVSVGRIGVDKTPYPWSSILLKYSNTNSSSSPDNGGTIPPYHSAGLSSLIQPESSKDKFIGVWTPLNCASSQTLAIIIPYRNRDEHLRVFVNHMHSFLRHQRLTYAIIVVEQLGNSTFNRGALMNIGFRESSKVAPFNCFIFSDVDLLPENDECPYRCQDQPVHLPVALDTFHYKLLYTDLFGGAVAMYRHQFVRVNGFSNAFFGWGGEDDDLSQRIRVNGYNIFRNPASICHFTMVRHKRDEFNNQNPRRFNLLKTVKARMPKDGFNDIEYNLVSAEARYNGLVYWVSVELDEELISTKFGIGEAFGICQMFPC